MFDSDAVPQADEVLKVAKVAEAVAGGATTFQEIAIAIGMVERQGRYYRLAAERIDFLEKVESNTSKLTPRGRRYAGSKSPIERRRLLIGGMMTNSYVRAILDFVGEAGAKGRTGEELGKWIAANTTATGTTAARRVNTVRRWLSDLGLVKVSGERTFIATPSELLGAVLLEPSFD